MNRFPWHLGKDDTIRPSLLQNGLLALGCLLIAVALFRGDDSAKMDGALLMALFLVLSAAVVLAVHLPGCTGIWLDDEGFLTRDMYKTERYRWSEVGPFSVRRRMLGTSVEFAFTQPGETMPQIRHLPRGLGRSPVRIARFMNEWRDRVLMPAS